MVPPPPAPPLPPPKVKRGEDRLLLTGVLTAQIGAAGSTPALSISPKLLTCKTGQAIPPLRSEAEVSERGDLRPRWTRSRPPINRPFPEEARNKAKGSHREKSLSAALCRQGSRTCCVGCVLWGWILAPRLARSGCPH